MACFFAVTEGLEPSASDDNKVGLAELVSEKRVANARARVAAPILPVNSGSALRIADTRVPRYSSVFPAGKALVAWGPLAPVFVKVLVPFYVMRFSPRLESR